MNVYLIFVVILFILAISDLIVGISNDAANFLNSAIGSKVAPMKVILSIAGLGVIVGATFSSGMMEIARSGIFHPGQFFFAEIMVIFLAVMITDVILLDTFNTFGFPTSTTVSIVFELLGAAVAVSLIKIFNSTDTLSDLGSYINSAKALAIIAGILLSVVMAFTFGMIVQFFTRLIFSFNFEKYMKYFGALWGGLAITAIIYFMLVKGAKGASFMTEETLAWFHENTVKLLIYSFIAIVIIFQILISFFRVNILRIIVLVGTFSLAMAFAGNDLVNFIGVPLAGFESFRMAIAEPAFNPDTFTMGALDSPVKTPTLFLLTAGLIMVATLFFSKKSRTVSQTEISLARQDEGAERFNSSRLSREVVRGSIGASKFFDRILPDSVVKFIESRFNPDIFRKKKKNKKDSSSFDQLRASVNMFVASILIAIATSLKLPLSTTYVTFMVAMGTSLSDRAWGRESAVFRITGVFSVIGGWFLTAVIAFTASFLVAVFIHWGGLVATFLALGTAIFFVIRSTFIHRNRIKKQAGKDDFDDKETLNGENILAKCDISLRKFVSSIPDLYFASLLNLIREDRRKMKKTINKIEVLNQNAKELKYNLYPTLRKLEEGSVESGHYYVQILDYLREIAHCLNYIAGSIFEYVDNNHPPLIKEQVKDLHDLNSSVNAFYIEVLVLIRNHSYGELDKMIEEQRKLLEMLAKMKKRHIKYIKSEMVGTRNTMMYLNILSETKNLLLFTVNLVKSHRDFIIESSKESVTVKISSN
ncbi:MAG TPA: inorganic phosphate transporter [Bacteroidales bacterium]|nr:inorganic phosphate transporter [Bacteroidales bacterium]HPJ58556.1 inorganic phosphate transporter [Bacteroidales bacterium]HPR11285.1 inorganic phosphate transporter [Bacteroidales bacterium]HRW86368.1 inorganic phosphate transporter [Bacteroidales bacterium]